VREGVLELTAALLFGVQLPGDLAGQGL